MSLEMDFLGLYYIAFCNSNFCQIVISYSDTNVGHLQPSLILGGKAGSQPLELS